MMSLFNQGRNNDIDPAPSSKKSLWLVVGAVGLSFVAVATLSGTSSSIEMQTSSIRARELTMSCSTDEDCPSLYCRELPCTAFECRGQECLVTTLTAAPETSPPTNSTIADEAIATDMNMTNSNYTEASSMGNVTSPAPTMATPPAPSPPMLEEQVAVSAFDFAFAGNDVCSSAIGPIPVTAEGLGNSRAILTHGTSNGAAVPTSLAPTCNSIRHNGPGVWYTVIGTGARMTASTCWYGTDYDTAISVYTSSRRRDLKKEDDNTVGASGGSGGCSSLQCVNANDDASGNFGSCRINSLYSRVQWESVRGETYYILVHSFNNRVGNFDLNVITARPLNERCSDAISIPISDDTIIGTTFQAELPWGSNKATNCGESTSRGLTRRNTAISN